MRFPPIHPLLFAVYPVLFLWSSNVGGVNPDEIIFPMIISAGTALALLLVPHAWSGWDLRRIGIWVSFCICMFFSYWVLWHLGSYTVRGEASSLSNQYFLAIWSLTIILGTMCIARICKKLDRLTSALNIMACFLVGYSVLNIGWHSIGGADPILQITEARLDNSAGGLKGPDYAAQMNPKRLPDIYYIILDAYGRSDVLKDFYKYDNEPFLEWLSQKGFYVVGKSRTNYVHTYLSLASSLNYCYLDHISRRIKSGKEGERLLTVMIRNS